MNVEEIKFGLNLKYFNKIGFCKVHAILIRLIV